MFPKVFSAHLLHYTLLPFPSAPFPNLLASFDLRYAAFSYHLASLELFSSPFQLHLVSLQLFHVPVLKFWRTLSQNLHSNQGSCRYNNFHHIPNYSCFEDLIVLRHTFLFPLLNLLRFSRFFYLLYRVSFLLLRFPLLLTLTSRLKHPSPPLLQLASQVKHLSHLLPPSASRLKHLFPPLLPSTSHLKHLFPPLLP